jgi:hypothetical protein
MSYFRSYFSKNNTIIKDSEVNTAKNPDTEIFYGSSFSKYIFQIDLDDLTWKINNGYLVLDANTKHYLHLTNTIFGDPAFIGQIKGNGRQRTTSFDLIVFKINEEWDEGYGFDYEESVDLNYENLFYRLDYQTNYEESTYDTRPSNWYNKTTLSGWTSEGIYAIEPPSGDTIATIHFDNGNENLVADITDYVNSILTGSATNYGLGIAFHPLYMNITVDEDQSVAFFSKYTQTFFEPYVESIFYDNVIDDRNNFIIERNNNLCLFVSKNGVPYDLDELPIVDILDYNNTTIPGLSGLTTTKIRKGIYQITFALTGILCDGKKFYYDKWRNIIIDGIAVNDITKKFIPKPITDGYSIGEYNSTSEKYIIQFYGVQLNEKIVRGETRKIAISFKTINQPIGVAFDNVYYRIFVKEGKTQFIVFDWTLMDKTTENFFMLDTIYLIPREYFIEIKTNINGEELIYKEEIKFEIVSERGDTLYFQQIY